MIKGRKGKETLEKEVKDLGLDTSGVEIEVDDDGGMKEKIILAVGNVEGVAGVEDKAGSVAGGRESQFHTVVSGDTLGAISKTYYGTWRLYPEIFEANKPMLSHPDKIYPGQVLRIPAVETATS